MSVLNGRLEEAILVSQDNVFLNHVTAQQMTLFIGLCIIASWLLWCLVAIQQCVCICMYVCVCVWFNARSSEPVTGGNSFGAPQEHPGQVFGSPSELCSPLLLLLETGKWGWMGRERKVTIWQED